MHMLAEMSWGQWLVAMLIIVICAFLMLVILLQRGRGGGLAGAFGGAGGSSAFGSKTGDVFTWITVVVATAFVIVCAIGGFVFEPESVAQSTVLPTTTDTAPVTLPPSNTTTTTVNPTTTTTANPTTTTTANPTTTTTIDTTPPDPPTGLRIEG